MKVKPLVINSLLYLQSVIVSEQYIREIIILIVRKEQSIVEQ